MHPSGLSNLPSLLVLSSTPSVRQIAWHTLTNVNEQRTPPHLKLSPLHKEGKPILDSILFLTTKKRWQNSHKVRIDLRFLFILLTQLKVSTSLGYQFEHLAMSYVDICMDGRIKSLLESNKKKGSSSKLCLFWFYLANNSCSGFLATRKKKKQMPLVR